MLALIFYYLTIYKLNTMKTKKLELRKEVIASLSNDAMASVVGGDMGYNTEDNCVGSAVPYSQKPSCRPMTLSECANSVKVCKPVTGIKCEAKTKVTCPLPATLEVTNCIEIN